MKDQKTDQYHLRIQRPHLVLLGAGASRAAFPTGEKNGLKLPLMDDFVETVGRLADYLKECEIDHQEQNFEELYSALYEDSKYDQIRQNIEELVYDYFSGMQLPDKPTLYDHLVLSLTGRDAIATFNWDPLLWQALYRNCNRVGSENLPCPIYLHGNTATRVCTNHTKIQVYGRGFVCPKCGKRLQKSKLLYPIKRKDYNTDCFIKSSWNAVKGCLEAAYMLTIFGYGAPSSDVEAINLLSEGWGNKYQRNMEQIELVDVLDEDILRERWDKFIHTHHYRTHNNFYSSMIAKCSRRSADAFFNAAYDCIAWDEYPIPQDAPWDELDEWLKPYIEVENKSRKST